MSPNCSASHSANVTHSSYARAPDLTVTLSRIAVQYLTLILHQHTEAKDVITSKTGLTGMYCRRTHWGEGNYLVEKPQRKRSFGTRRLEKNREGFHPFGTRGLIPKFYRTY
jgi:hypothetical protein